MVEGFQRLYMCIKTGQFLFAGEQFYKIKIR